MKLQDIFNSHTDKHSAKWSHYFDIYDRHLEKYIGKEVTLIEIGVQNGGSLQLWKKYLGDKANIVGIDIDPRAMYEEDQIKTFLGDQGDTNFLQSVLDQIGTPDIVIDDGGHHQVDILKSFDFFYDKLSNDGVYIIEDLLTSYKQEWGGGIDHPDNFMNVISKNIHDVNLNWIHTFDTQYKPKLDNLKSMCFYESMAVFEKELRSNKSPVHAGVNRYV